MATNRVQRGDIITITAAAGQTSGETVVVVNLVGVALNTVLIGEINELAIEEVYALPKVDAAVITVGMRVIFDVSAGEVDDDAATPASGDVSNFGVAVEAKGVTVGETIAVKLTPGVGTVTP